MRKAVQLVVACVVAAQAFRVPAPAVPLKVRSPSLRMQEAEPPAEPEDARAAYDAAVKAEGEMAAGSTLFDDEKPFVEKPPISSEMRAKLLKGQQALGSDPNSQNPFLYVFGGVGVFVILGAIAVNM